MGQKVNPIGLRLGIIRGWDSNWYGGKDFGQKLVEDDKIRKYLKARLQKAEVSKIYIERTLKLITITINTARPGLIIGRLGQEVDKLKEELKKITSKDIQINISEIKRPELDAVLVSQTIANQIEGRMFYRRVVKAAIASTMRAGAEGIKVSISGRIGGAEMARTEHFKDGRTPLHTLRADIDYNHAEAHTTYGRLGVKVWICRGLIYGKNDLFQSSTEGKSGQQKRDREKTYTRGDRGDRYDRGGGRGNRDNRDRDRGRNNDRNDRNDRKERRK
ncbi:MAG: 30S ribosomal protein S3 [Bacteroidales bacterium]|jgi:small subunit ribosomal protein S3|nr:30S ribosomal protein S3 [Bacteroidales bacterium]